MPMIYDGRTPQGRFVKCWPTESNSSPCKVRKMTAEERDRYGEAVPPSRWGRPPSFACMGDDAPQQRTMTFSDDDDFRRKMKRERLKRNMTQHRLGEFCGMSGNVIGKIERGVKEATEERKQLICKVFGWDYSAQGMEEGEE